MGLFLGYFTDNSSIYKILLKDDVGSNAGSKSDCMDCNGRW
jgi:hypothetical protein